MGAGAAEREAVPKSSGSPPASPATASFPRTPPSSSAAHLRSRTPPHRRVGGVTRCMRLTHVASIKYLEFDSSAATGDRAGRIQQYFAAGPGTRQQDESRAAFKLHAGNDQGVVAHVMPRIRTQGRKQFE